MLNGHRVRIGIEVRQCLKLGGPAAIDLVGECELARLVVDLDDDVFTKVFQRHFAAQTRAEVPYLVGPLFKLGVVSNAALESDRFIFSPARRFATAARITT